MDDDEVPLSKHDQQFVAGALDCVQLKFLKCENEIGKKDQYVYNVEFAHQHFGEAETIFGYQNLSITINYTSASLYIYPEISYTRTSSQGGSDIPPDDIYTLLKSQLPEEHMDIMVQSKKDFLRKLDEQKTFQPFGELIRAITIEASSSENEPSAKRSRHEPKTFELRKIDTQTSEFERYLAQLQTLALWYIDAAEYTDNDHNWLHYLLFETYDQITADGSTAKRYAVAGYASLYRFYHYRDQQRLRIAHMLLLPPYRQSGLGAKFLNSIYEDLWSMPIIYDITVEDAADGMIYLRDYLDCLHCQTLPDFSCDNLKKGFSADMELKARENFKIYSKQARRVYEILRFIATNKSDEEELKSYRIDVKRRLEKPFKRRPKDLLKLEKCVDPEMVKDMADMKPEVKLDQLASLYEETIKGYQVVVDRLAAHPTV